MIRSLVAVFALSVAWNTLADETCDPLRYTSPLGTTSTKYGWRIVTNGRQWIVADPQASTLCGGSPLACSTGAVHVYGMVDGELVHAQTIVPDDAELGDQFGSWVDVDDNQMIVGSLYTRSPRSGERAGAVFIYEHDGQQWIEAARIEPLLPVRREFGSVVTIDGGVAIVKQLSYEPQYVYHETPDGWILVETLHSPDGTPPESQYDGWVQLSSDWLFVSASRDASAGVADGGSVYIYRRQSDDSFAYHGKLFPPQPETSQRFGSWTSYDGETLAIQAPWADREFEAQGVVFIYELEGDQWVFRQELTHSRPGRNHVFGRPVEVHGDLLLARANENYSTHFGVVYAFKRDPLGVWREADRLIPNPPELAAQYGQAIATDGRYVLNGASQDYSSGGAAYLFDMNCRLCTVDLDADGILTIFDFLTYLNLFQDGDPLADFDGDGELTVFDFLAFQTAFEAGCA